jgi:hypothetical protein
MNEKILKLADKAGINYATGFGYSDDAVGDLQLEKFAELIVKECIQAFEAEVDTWKQMDPYQGSMKRKGTKAIKQHFGVEE